MQLPYSNLQLKHQNPGAMNPLILPIHVVCNTSDEALFDNIRTNSRRHGEWLKASPAHERVAVLCGSGPSLAQSIPAIKWRQEQGATVFAMNGAAKFLDSHGIRADYQVIIDAREETATLVGPAKEHLFASQVHPACFERMPNAKVWHLQITDIDDYLPEYDDDFVMIGGAASVGNTSTCLAYAMGYRSLQIYGYDSSHKDGKGHAFHQKMNDGDPCAIVNFCGKEYLTSLTMKLQAEKFQDTARDLKMLGVHIEVHGEGLLPDMFNAPRELLTEQQKYERMWAYKSYRNLAPGEECVPIFAQRMPWQGSVIDFGCGTGRASVKLKALGYDVLLVDFADNCRDYEAMVLPFVKHDLTEPLAHFADMGICTDVMEHLPTDKVATVLANIMASVKTVFLQISTAPDSLGALINQELHLTVKPHAWWLNVLGDHGTVKWHEEQPVSSMFILERNPQ